MIAVDTNIVLRLILDDDEAQVAAILSLLALDRFHVSLGVMLETGWVLASRYRLARDEVAAALRAVRALDRVEVARAELVGWAIDRYAAGADWADMIHLVASAGIGAFATLDRGVARRAGDHAPVRIATLA